jgi:mRNA-degrading endonuclease RelE of RelBE toxin-antitoxin system
MKRKAPQARVKTLDRLDRHAYHHRMATVRVTPEAYKQADRLPKVIHARVLKLVKRLENWPNVSGYKALSGKLASWYRLRTGDYRLRFRVEGESIIVDKIGHRSEFYED